METLINCDIMIDIELIEMISGRNQSFEVKFLTKDKTKYKLAFDWVWDLRYSIENGYIDRFSKFIRGVEQESSVLLVENSKYIKYFESQVSGTRPVNDLKNYIIYDTVDTVIEVLTAKEPKLLRI